jgi:chemotaxis protein methyltransferase CheR
MMVHEFNLLRRILRESSGIELSEDKRDLAEAKLRPLLNEFEFPSFAHFTLALTKPNADRLRLRVAQSIAVLESYFFRDKTPFSYFSEVMLPRLMTRRPASRRIRIWCAAAATGQEPYSLAMLLDEAGQKLDGWKVEIVATDFAEAALLKAQTGVYSQFEVQRGLPVSMLIKYFQKASKGWQIKPEIRARVAFHEHNLLDDCQELGTFDVIFCRNVLIYFDETLRKAVLGRLSRQLASDGYLVLGAAETATRVSPEFRPVPEAHHGIYCFTPEAAARAEEAARERRRPKPVEGPPSGGGPAVMGGHGIMAVGGPKNAPAADDTIRAVELDRETADRLEARAKARGVSVARLLAEFALDEGSGAEARLVRPLKVVTG